MAERRHPAYIPSPSALSASFNVQIKLLIDRRIVPVLHATTLRDRLEMRERPRYGAAYMYLDRRSPGSRY